MERVDLLEKELMHFEAWESEKKKYTLAVVGPGSFAYVIKPEMQGADPEYLLYPTCYNQRKSSILQSLPQF